MTISTTSSTIVIAATGAVSYQFPFIGVSASDISVFYTNTSGTITTVPSTAYTVSLNAPVTGSIWGIGGTISMVTPSNYTSGSLTITRTLPFTQSAAISNQGNQYPIVTETALDTLCMEIQQVAARTGAYRGVWATGTVYNFGDIVQDGINGAYTNNIYVAAQGNTSGVWATDLAAGDWVLSVSVATLQPPGSFLPLTGGTISGNLTVSGTLTGTLTGNASTATTATTATNAANVTGTIGSSVTATTQAFGDNTTKPATDAFVQAAIPQTIQSISASVATNALTIGYAGGSLSFRNATLSTGTTTSLLVGSLSLVVPSTATLGTINTVQSQLILLVAYNAGTPVLCIVNSSGGVNLDETTLISPTTISTGATSAGVIYSASSVAANSPFRVVGYINITEATAGTWATAPSLVQGEGGQALVGMQTLGFGQTWQTFTAGVNRVQGVTYYNTTPRPITVLVNAIFTSASVNINGASMVLGNTSSATPLSFIVPPNNYYVVTTSGAYNGWMELR